MVAQLNHTIVAARDKYESATFFSEILGLPAPVAFGHFLVVPTGNDGGRGFYFEDPSGHYLEVLTRPYGSGA